MLARPLASIRSRSSWYMHLCICMPLILVDLWSGRKRPRNSCMAAVDYGTMLHLHGCIMTAFVLLLRPVSTTKLLPVRPKSATNLTWSMGLSTTPGKLQACCEGTHLHKKP